MEIFKKLKKIKIKIYVKGQHEVDLLESHIIGIANIEFTSRCNLKCVYCAASQPDYDGTDLNPQTIETIIESLKNGNVRIVNVNGHGETTIYKNWHLFCNKMLDMGLNLHITSNFAKEFSDEELKTLSRFENITISCDTSCPELFKKLRFGADLRTLCLNILKLREMALKNNRRLPSFGFNCVISDQNVLDLMDFCVFAKILGVNYINFCNLKKYPDLEGYLNPVQILEMPIDLLPEVKASLEQSLKFLRRNNIQYQIQGGLLDSLDQRIQEIQSTRFQDNLKAKTPGNEKNHIHNKPEKREPIEAGSFKEETDQHRLSSTREKIQTRDCLEPWSFIMVQANKEVLPCCWYRSLHSSGIYRSLFEVFNNTKFRELRWRLLTGDLPPDCMDCTYREWTSTDNLKKKVWNYLNPGIVNKLLFSFRKVTEVKPDILIPFEIVYKKGWYHPEINLDIEDRDWQRWRWTSKEALCLLKNPEKDTLLIIQGAVDKLKYDDQKVIIKINGHTLDTFVPTRAKFLKEYKIKKELMGKRSKTRLLIETDKTFVPAEMNPEINDNRELGIQIYRLFFGERRKGVK